MVVQDVLGNLGGVRHVLLLGLPVLSAAECACSGGASMEADGLEFVMGPVDR